MTQETFERARELTIKLDHFTVKKTQVQSMKERDDDEDFNLLRQLAFDGIIFAMKVVEQEFEKL